MATALPASVRALVRQRALNRCEYCRLHQDSLPLTPFHIEHIIAQTHGGSHDPSNLALACSNCNLHKGTNLSGIDPLTSTIIPLYHPRTDLWEAHFEYQGALIGVREFYPGISSG